MPEKSVRIPGAGARLQHLVDQLHMGEAVCDRCHQRIPRSKGALLIDGNPTGIESFRIFCDNACMDAVYPRVHTSDERAK